MMMAIMSMIVMITIMIVMKMMITWVTAGCLPYWLLECSTW